MLCYSYILRNFMLFYFISFQLILPDASIKGTIIEGSESTNLKFYCDIFPLGQCNFLCEYQRKVVVYTSHYKSCMNFPFKNDIEVPFTLTWSIYLTEPISTWCLSYIFKEAGLCYINMNLFLLATTAYKLSYTFK